MLFTNPEPDEIKALLQRVTTIAVVGFSPKPGRPSHNIARRMQEGAEDGASAERARRRHDRGHGSLHHARLHEAVPWLAN